jgi:hypothetical protein
LVVVHVLVFDRTFRGADVRPDFGANFRLASALSSISLGDPDGGDARVGFGFRWLAFASSNVWICSFSAEFCVSARRSFNEAESGVRRGDPAEVRVFRFFGRCPETGVTGLAPASAAGLPVPGTPSSDGVTPFAFRFAFPIAIAIVGGGSRLL